MTITVAWAGFVAIVFAAAFFWLLRSFGVTQFSPTVQLGCLFLRDPRHPATETVGFVLLLLLGSTLVPALYAMLFAAASGPSWGLGLLVGAVHGALTVAALPALGTISACIRAGRMEAPGRFGLDWGRLTPVGIVLGHALYGAVCGAILANF